MTSENVCRNSMLLTRHYPDLGSAKRESFSLGSAYRLSKFPRGRTNQNHYSELGSDTSSVWNFCARMSDVISWGKPVMASRNVGCFLRLVKKRRACLKTLVGYCSSECLLHFWSLFHHPKTLWCLRIPWITYLFGWVVIHQINLLLK